MMLTRYWVRLFCSDCILADSLFSGISLAEDKLSNSFFNLETCVVSIVKVSNDSNQVIINWTKGLVNTTELTSQLYSEACNTTAKILDFCRICSKARNARFPTPKTVTKALARVVKFS